MTRRAPSSSTAARPANPSAKSAKPARATAKPARAVTKQARATAKPARAVTKQAPATAKPARSLAAKQPGAAKTTRATDTSSEDGRRLRAARNRDAVVAAVLDIVRERPAGAAYLPGAAEVAARAGVSERTVFRHFADLDSLFMAAAARQRPVHAAFVGPRPDAPDVTERITALVRLRARLYEQIAPVRRVAIRLSATQPLLAEQLQEAYRATRSQVLDTFAPELARLDARSRADMVEALDVIAGWSTWDKLRTVQGCSVERSKRVMTDLLVAVLVPVAKQRRHR